MNWNLLFIFLLYYIIFNENLFIILFKIINFGLILLFNNIILVKKNNNN